jgi:UDP-N-acetylmuramyl pentapeptide phosphotransferase/UDP-N-acetylglucosamine-1-phosphate transferase
MIPVFDTLRVFGTRIWRGKSPFIADRTHIHHLLTNNGISHSLATRLICIVHAIILIDVYMMRNVRPELVVAVLFAFMILVTFIFSNINLITKWFAPKSDSVPSEN